MFLRMLIVAGVIAVGVIVALLIVRFVLERVFRTRRQWPEAPSDEPRPEQFMLPDPPQQWTGKMDRAFEQMVDRSGSKLTSAHLLAWICFSGVAAAGGLVLWRPELWVAAFGLAFGMAVPLLAFLVMQRRWRRKMQDQLPDALFLISRSIRAGLSLEQAMALVGTHGTQPLAAQFQDAAERCKLGLSVPAAIQGMAERVELEDMDGLVSVVTLHRTVGGNLAELLDRLATSARDRNQFQGFFRAATALGRLTAICLAAIAPVLFIGYLVWQPEYMTRFAATSAGMLALGIALMLELIGVMWLWAMMKFET
jgi:tight adherence protein B